MATERNAARDLANVWKICTCLFVVPIESVVASAAVHSTADAARACGVGARRSRSVRTALQAPFALRQAPVDALFGQQ